MCVLFLIVSPMPTPIPRCQAGLLSKRSVWTLAGSSLGLHPDSVTAVYEIMANRISVSLSDNEDNDVIDLDRLMHSTTTPSPSSLSTEPQCVCFVLLHFLFIISWLEPFSLLSLSPLSNPHGLQRHQITQCQFPQPSEGSIHSSPTSVIKYLV